VAILGPSKVNALIDTSAAEQMTFTGTPCVPASRSSRPQASSFERRRVEHKPHTFARFVDPK